MLSVRASAGLEDRTFNAEHWWSVATPLLARTHGFHVEEIGRSVEDRPLRHVRWGDGRIPVLLWSQMHGDESTASMALADLFGFLGDHPDHPLVRQLRANTTLHVFPIVNPDGAARFQRRNVQGIDLNRDARMLATPAGAANSTNSKPSMPIGLSNVVGCMPRLGCAFMGRLARLAWMHANIVSAETTHK